MVALLAAATSCDKYDIYPESFDSVLSIRDAGTRNISVYSTDEVTEVPFVVMKGGYEPETSSTATLKVMSNAEFEAYKENSGNTLYTSIGSECYSFSPNENEQVHSVEFSFNSADKKYDHATLYIRPSKLETWLDNNAATIDGYTPCVPVKLESTTDTVSSYNNVTLVCVNLSSPVLSLDVNDVISRVINKNKISASDNSYTPEVNLSIPCKNPWGFKVNMKIDDKAFNSYNDKNNGRFKLLPEDAYTFNKTIDFAVNTTYKPLGLKIDLSKLTDNVNYAIAIKIDEENPITWNDPNNTPGNNLEVNTDGVVILTVRVVEAVILKKVNLTDADVTANDQSTAEGSISALFDGNTGTYYHSDYSAGTNRTETYGSYLEITLPTEMTTFRFDWVNRDSPTAAGYAKLVHLFGTNDTNNWPDKPFAVIDDMNAAGMLDKAKASASFGTDEEPFMCDIPVKYLRVCVMESGGGNLTSPSTRYWCASGFTLYGNY